MIKKSKAIYRNQSISKIIKHFSSKFLSCYQDANKSLNILCKLKYHNAAFIQNKTSIFSFKSSCGLKRVCAMLKLDPAAAHSRDLCSILVWREDKEAWGFSLCGKELRTLDDRCCFCGDSSVLVFLFFSIIFWSHASTSA